MGKGFGITEISNLPEQQKTALVSPHNRNLLCDAVISVTEEMQPGRNSETITCRRFKGRELSA